jgi:mRNA interferase RelE/StbE
MASNWEVRFEQSAEKALGLLDDGTRTRVIRALERLADEMSHNGQSMLSDIRKLKRSKDKYRLKIADWRVIFSFEHAQLVILALEIGHRSKIYRDRA